MISKNPEDLQFYEARLKFLRDKQAQIEAAEQEARKEARKEGRAEGRAEGMLAGKVQLLQELLGEPISEESILAATPIDDIEAQLVKLQQRMRNRDA